MNPPDPIVAIRARRGWPAPGGARVAGGCKLALCRRHGFREVGTCEKHARLDSHWRDAIIVEQLI